MPRLLTQDILLSELKYDPETGIFERVNKPRRKNNNGKIGSISDGYTRIYVNGHRHFAHKLAWLYTYGRFPSEQIDHINHKRSDNRISNLREVSHTDNQRNQVLRKRNKSGHTGVFFRKSHNRWIAKICVSNKIIQLGSYIKKEDAIMARQKANKIYGFHENHGRTV